MAIQFQNMVLIKLSNVICLLSLIEFSHCQRRIKGAKLNTDKVYAVYMVKEKTLGKNNWLCGGAIVTEWYIITSAACVYNVNYTYVIAGYKKFVPVYALENDECTKRKKKRIVFTCVPKYRQGNKEGNKPAYEFAQAEMYKWTHGDIAVVKVESKYDFKDKSYLQYCSYIPGPIHINYDGKYQQPGTDTIALGWGHNESFMVPVTKNYNQDELKYAPLLLVPKSVCKEAYSGEKIDEFLLCAQGAGNLDDVGDIINKDVHRVVGCVIKDQKLKGWRGTLCDVVDTDYYSDPYDDAYKTNDNGNDNITRRDLRITDVTPEEIVYDEVVNNEKLLNLATSERQKYLVWRPTKTTTKKPNNRNDWSTNKPLREEDYENNYDNSQSGDKEKKEDKDKSDENVTNGKSAARSKTTFNLSNVGICQNDHGGPLVTWVGTRETLIGVISAFKVSSESKCMGPYLITSTQCNSKFIDCVINYSTQNDTRRQLCDSPNVIGFVMRRRYISWADHPSGPAENEIVEGRQQISVQQYNSGN